MNRDKANVVAIIVDKITKLENTIFEVQTIMDKKSFDIIAYDNDNDNGGTQIKLKPNDVSTIVFTQDILKLYVDTLNLELNELIKELENY